MYVNGPYNTQNKVSFGFRAPNPRKIIQGKEIPVAKFLKEAVYNRKNAPVLKEINRKGYMVKIGTSPNGAPAIKLTPNLPDARGDIHPFSYLQNMPEFLINSRKKDILQDVSIALRGFIENFIKQNP